MANTLLQALRQGASTAAKAQYQGTIEIWKCKGGYRVLECLRGQWMESGDEQDEQIFAFHTSPYDRVSAKELFESARIELAV